MINYMNIAFFHFSSSIISYLLFEFAKALLPFYARTIDHVSSGFVLSDI